MPSTPNLDKSDDFERHALAHMGELFAIALRYARNPRDAEDLVQETLLRAYVAWEQFEPGTNCRAWLFRILTNNFINECRRLTKERRWVGQSEPMMSTARRRAARDPEGTIVEHALGDEVVAALAGLPAEFRQVVVFADLEGLSYRDIARRVGCPIGTVMSRLYRGRRLLEARLGDYAREHGIQKAA